VDQGCGYFKWNSFGFVYLQTWGRVYGILVFLAAIAHSFILYVIGSNLRKQLQNEIININVPQYTLPFVIMASIYLLAFFIINVVGLISINVFVPTTAYYLTMFCNIVIILSWRWLQKENAKYKTTTTPSREV